MIFVLHMFQPFVEITGVGLYMISVFGEQIL